MAHQLNIDKRDSNKIEVLCSILIFISLSVSFYPIDPPELKASYLSYLIISISIICFISINVVLKNKYIVILVLLSVVFLILTHIHQIYNPPLTRYAESKFRNLAFSIMFFLLMVPAIFSNGNFSKLLMNSVLSFSLLYCGMSLFYDPAAQDLRYSESGLNPTLMATIVLIPAIYALSHEKKKIADKIVLYSLIILSLWFSIKTGSRGPVLSLVIAYGLFLVIKNGIRGSLSFIVYAPLIVAITVFFVSLLPAEISYRFSLNEFSIDSQSDEGDRITLWRIALIGLQQTWTGYGLGNYSVMTFLAAPHNIFLESMFELGIYISIIYAIIILFPLLGLRYLVKERSLPVDFFVILYIFNLFLSVINGEMTLTSVILYISVGFIWGYIGWKKAYCDKSMTINSRHSNLA